MKTQWTEEEIRAAAECSSCINEIMDKLKTRKIRAECPVLCTVDPGHGWNGELRVTFHGDIPRHALDIRALIPVDTARKIARKAIVRYGSSPRDIESATRQVDEAHDAYKYVDGQG